MADGLEIINVGGRDGVASEATMQLLLTEFRARASSDSQYQKAAQRAQEQYNSAQKRGTGIFGKFNKALDKASDSLAGRFIKETAVGGDRLGDFAEAIFGANSRLTRFVRFGDDTIDTLRGLTSVGASFNNNIFDMIGASANSAMRLDDFASMVQNNSTVLATFGSTVTAGARNLGQFSKEFRTGIGQEFFAMGFTIGDVNEGLISFLDLERRRSLAGLRTDRASQQAAADYIIQLDQLTKLTGEEREQVADRLRQQMQDAGVRAQVNRLEGTARTNFQNSLAFIESQLSGPLADGLKDLMDGVAQTDLGKALQSQVPGIGEFAQQMFRGGKSVDEVIDAMTNRFGPQLQSLSGQFSKAQLDQMRMSGGITGAIAEILDSSYQINQLTGRDAEAAAEEQTRRDRITATLGGFENAITNIRKFFVDAFLDASNRTDGLAAAFKNLFATVGKLFGDGPGSFAELGPTVTKYFNNWFGTGGTVTNLVNRFSDALATTDWEALFTSIDNTFTSFTDWLSGIYETYKSEGFGAALTQAGNNVLNSILDLFLGKIGPNEFGEEGRGQRQGGLIKSIYDGIVGMLESTGATEFMTRVYDTVYNFLFEEDANGKTKMETFLSTAYQKIYDFLFTADSGGQSKLSAFLSTAYQKIYDFIFVAEDGGKSKLSSFLSDTYNEIYDFLFAQDETGKNKWINFLETVYNDLYNYLFPQTSGPSFLEKVQTKLNEMIFGTETRPDGTGGRSGGLIETIANAFKSFMENNTVVEAMKNAITTLTNSALIEVDSMLRTFLGMTEGQSFTEKLTEMISDMTNTILNIIEVRIPALIRTAMTAARSAVRDTVGGAGGTDLGSNPLLEAVRKLESGTLQGEERQDLINTIRSLQRQRDNSGAFVNTLGNMSEFASDIFNLDNLVVSDQALLQSVQKLTQEGLIPPRAKGTYGATGQTSEPEGGLMNIHKGERVLSPEETRAYNQTGGDNKLDQLNNTMMQVVALLAQGNQISERTAKGLRGMTNDYYRGMA